MKSITCCALPENSFSVTFTVFHLSLYKVAPKTWISTDYEMFSANTGSIQKPCIRYRTALLHFPLNNSTVKHSIRYVTLTGALSCTSYQLWTQTPQTEQYHLTQSSASLLAWSWPVTQNLSETTRKALLTQRRALYHSTWIWKHYGSRFLWMGFALGRSWPPLWPAEILHTHHLLPAMGQFGETLANNSNKLHPDFSTLSQEVNRPALWKLRGDVV